MRFDELVLQIPDDELRVRFHPRMTVLCGLGAPERQALADSILGVLTGRGEPAGLRYIDGTGRTVMVRGGTGTGVLGRYDDDHTPADPPLGAMTASPDAVRSLMLVRASDVGVPARPPSEDDPPELIEARALLEELTAQLAEATAAEELFDSLRADLARLDAELESAREGVARREYAKVLARLERVRAEAATIRSGTTGVDADRHLIDNVDAVAGLGERWTMASDRLADAVARFADTPRLAPEDLAEAAALPEAPPAELETLVEAARAADEERLALEHRLQVLAAAKLPAPSELLVGELGLLDSTALWHAADRLLEALAEVRRLQLAMGGLGGEAGAEAPAEIAEMEAAHQALEDAERAAESVRVSGVAGTGLGATIAALGAIGLPVLMPVGLLVASVVGTVTLLLPRSRVAKAAAEERLAVERAGAGSYLGFHLRRVDAAVDPTSRRSVDVVANEHRAAQEAWTALVGPGVDVEQAKALQDEVVAYSEALRSLGGAADEIEQLRRALADEAEPAVARTAAAVAEACRPFALDDDDLVDVAQVPAVVAAQIQRGIGARRQLDLEDAEAAEQAAAEALGNQLRQLGFDGDDLPARLGALDWAVARATEREQARANARDPQVIDAELRELEEAAGRLRRPEWSGVTPAEADTPDIPDLEERREKLVRRLEEARPSIDVARLADRHAAGERRVTALEAKLGGYDVNGDPGAVADLQQHLLGHLTKAAQAGPHQDPVPVLLDEVLQRVPAERKWDLLDLIHRLSERHQVVYLSDDAFVAAWARQCPDGAITLLEPAPETV